MSNIWRVGHNSSGSEQSLDTGNLETFKKEPMASFAREIVQNSIDAKRADKEKVVVEFKLFDVEKNKIPDHNTLKSGLFFVLENWRKKAKENDLRRMNEMYQLFDNETIKCMRVSDFNTTGLLGVKEFDETSPFYALTKGDGISFKIGTTGGSKGIGKFAAFVVSKIHTIFYSTLTESNEEGYLGTARLPSGIYVHKDGKRDDTLKTTGEWYFSSSDRNIPILEQLHLDDQFSREKGQTGTDLFIIGFDEFDNWQLVMVEKILESFIVAIMEEQLEVVVDGTKINKNTVNSLIEKLEGQIKISSFRTIKSMYDLLTDETVYKKDVYINNLGILNLYIKSYEANQENYASKKCVIVRYPYMRIRDISGISHIPFSALAIINDDKINETLRKFENPEHTDWYFNRPDYLIEERKKAKYIYDQIKEAIHSNIREALLISESEQIDVEGASEFLPQDDIKETGFAEEKAIVELPKIHRKKKARKVDQIGYVEDVESESLQPDLGEEGELTDAYGNDKGDGGTQNNKHQINPGNDNDAKIKKELKGIRYSLIALDSKKGKYLIRFTHNENVSDCNLILRIMGDSGSKEKHDFNILSAIVDGADTKVEQNQVIGFNILKDQVTNILISTDQKELFSGVVTIYASR